jgi:hypothetical protein
MTHDSTVNLPAAFHANLTAFASKNTNYLDVTFSYLLIHIEYAPQLVSKMVLFQQQDYTPRKLCRLLALTW